MEDSCKVGQARKWAATEPLCIYLGGKAFLPSFNTSLQGPFNGSQALFWALGVMLMNERDTGPALTELSRVTDSETRKMEYDGYCDLPKKHMGVGVLGGGRVVRVSQGRLPERGDS